MKGAARGFALLLVMLGAGVFLWLWNAEPKLQEGSVVTREGVVTDRAMSDGLPYITVEFPDGTAICCWELSRDGKIPEELRVGQEVAITYGMEKSRDRFVFLEAKLEGRDDKK